MLFNSIRETNRLRKEINKLLSKWMLLLRKTDALKT